MFKEKGVVLVVFLMFAIVIFSSYTSAICTPSYSCGHWGPCDNGFQLRTCGDDRCGMADIVDRRICVNDGKPTCTINYKCEDWGICTYFDRTEDILRSEVKYSGIQSRSCIDSAGCADSFSEERTCEDAYKVNFVKIQQCGSEFLVAQDPSSKKSLAQINLDTWRKQILDISFVQNNFSYCPSCYNSFKDSDETGIDCGGSCKPCKIETNNYSTLVLSSWFFSILLFIGLLGTFYKDQKYLLRFTLIRAYFALENRDIKSLKDLNKKIDKIYSSLNTSERQAFSKEVSRFKDRFEDLMLRISRSY